MSVFFLHICCNSMVIMIYFDIKYVIKLNMKEFLDFLFTYTQDVYIVLYFLFTTYTSFKVILFYFILQETKLHVTYLYLIIIKLCL